MLAPGDGITGGGNNPDDDVTKLFGRIALNWGGAAE